MTRRKPLPYAAAYLIDDALMSLAVAGKQLRPLLDKTDLETVARTGRALDELHHATASLTEAKNTRDDG